MSLRKALVIDDSKVAHMTLRKLLIERGMEVEWAASGEAGVEYLRQHRPDVVFMDVMMPGMDGFEATALLTRSKDLDAPPIIMCSANASEGDQKQARASGASGFLSKPYTPEELTDVLSSIERQAATPRATAAAVPAVSPSDSRRVQEIAEAAARSLLEDHVPAMVRNVAVEVASSIARQMIQDAEPVHREMARGAAEETAHRVAAEVARASVAESARQVAQASTRQALDSMLADLPTKISHAIENRLAAHMEKHGGAGSQPPVDADRVRQQVQAAIENSLGERINEALEGLLRNPAAADLLQNRVTEATDARLAEFRREHDLVRRSLATVEKSAREEASLMIEERLRESSPEGGLRSARRLALLAFMAGVLGCALGAVALLR